LACFLGGTAIIVFSYEVTATMGSVFAGLSAMPLAALSLFAISPPAGLRRSSGSYWAALGFGTIVLLLLNARGDSKMMLSFSFVPLALATLRRKSAALLIAFGVGFVGLYILVIAPLVGNMRAEVQVDERGGRSLLNTDGLGTVQTRLGSAFRDDPVEYLNIWLENLMLRLGDPVAAGVICDFVESAGLLHGAGMDYVPMSFIPRVLWRDKPFVERGRYFTTALGMSSDESSATTSTGQTAAGELFWNFGWPGVVIGMYVLGLAYSVAWWGADRGNPTNGVIEMTAFMGVTTSFVLGTGAAAGSAFVAAVASGIVLRSLIVVRGWIFPPKPKALAGSRRRAGVLVATCR
jgi:hypothetical protein